MANSQSQSEGIHSQAERVVRAYRELCAGSGASDFPFDQFRELVTECKRLEEWLSPPDAEPSAEPEPADKFALLYLEDARPDDVIDALRGVAITIDTDSGAIPDGLTRALRVLADKLSKSLHDVPPDVERRVIRKLAEERLG
jgi:hypothetical protein